jgi:hypothetical protein
MILSFIVEDGLEILKNNLSPTWSLCCLTKRHHSLEMYLSTLLLFDVRILQRKLVKLKPFFLISRLIVFCFFCKASLEIFLGKCYHWYRNKMYLFKCYVISNSFYNYRLIERFPEIKCIYYNYRLMKLTSTWVFELLAIASVTKVCNSYNPAAFIFTLHLVTWLEDFGFTYFPEVVSTFADFLFCWFLLKVWVDSFVGNFKEVN